MEHNQHHWQGRKLKSGFACTRQYTAHSHVLMNSASDIWTERSLSSKGLDIRSYFWCTNIVLKIEDPWGTGSAKNRSWNCSCPTVSTRSHSTVWQYWHNYIYCYAVHTIYTVWYNLAWCHCTLVCMYMFNNGQYTVDTALPCIMHSLMSIH